MRAKAPALFRKVRREVFMRGGPASPRIGIDSLRAILFSRKLLSSGVRRRKASLRKSGRLPGPSGPNWSGADMLKILKLPLASKAAGRPPTVNSIFGRRVGSVEFASSGSDPCSNSSLSFKPSPSVSRITGDVPIRHSTRSDSPSPSVSDVRLFGVLGSKPRRRSQESTIRSPSESESIIANCPIPRSLSLTT